MKYEIVLNIAGIDYKSSDESLNEALKNLGLTWEQIKGKGVMKITYGKQSLEQLFSIPQLKKIFANKIMRLVWAKRLDSLLK